MIERTNLVWIMLIFGLAPTIALTRSIEAQQISVPLLAPILVLIFGQVFAATILGLTMAAALVVFFAGIDLPVFRVGVKPFAKEKILSKLA